MGSALLKVTKDFGQSVNFHYAKLNMAGFVLHLLPHFALRCRMVELCAKAPKIHLPAGKIWKGDSRYGS
jgi:hypothetical protein